MKLSAVALFLFLPVVEAVLVKSGVLPPLWRGPEAARFLEATVPRPPLQGRADAVPVAALAVQGPDRDREDAWQDPLRGPAEGTVVAPATGGGETKVVSQAKLNSAGDSMALKSSLVFSSATSLVFLLVFSILRRWNYSVYAREEEINGGKASDGFFSWMRKVMDTDDDEVVSRAGLDGWALITFYSLHGRVIGMIGIPVVFVLCPINFLFSKRDEEWLERFDLHNMTQRPEFLWLYAAFTWFVVIAVTMMLYHSHQDFLLRRFQWLKTIPSPQATTIMFENLPKELRSDAALRDYFQGPQGVFMRNSDIVLHAYIVRRTKVLRQAWEAMMDTQQALDLATNRSEGAGQLPEEEVAALRAKLAQQREEVRRQRERVEQAVRDKDNKVCAPSGFVTFSSAVWQRLALKENFRADRTELIANFPPDPNDVIYDNLMDNAVRSFTWFVLGWLCLVGVFIFWSPVVAFVSSVTELRSLKQSSPWVRDALSSVGKVFPFFPGFLEGVLATGALRFFLAFLPFTFLSIIRTFFPVKAGAMAQFRLARWYFSFQLIFVFLVTTLGRGLLTTALDVAWNPGEMINLLARWLPQSSHFYLNYIIIGWTTLTFELIRISNLLRYWFYRFVYKSSVEEAKKQAEPEDEASFGLGARLGMASLMSAMTLVCCTCSPLILVFSLVYFLIGRTTYGYLLVHVETRKPDLGGVFWVEAVQQVFFILAMFIVLIVGVLAGQERTYRSGPATLAVSAFVPLYFMWQRIKSFEWETLPLEQLAQASMNRERAPTDRGNLGIYRQPECRIEC